MPEQASISAMKESRSTAFTSPATLHLLDGQVKGIVTRGKNIFAFQDGAKNAQRPAGWHIDLIDRNGAKMVSCIYDSGEANQQDWHTRQHTGYDPAL